MVKTDDYMESNDVALDSTQHKEMMENNGMLHTNWAPPRSKSAGLKYAEYESDESGGGGRIILEDTNPGTNSKIMSCIDGAGEQEDRRLRRQIANCNERRRMQSINAGFQALRQLLPHKDGDKMSKASILSTTAEFIQTLLHERSKLIEENAITTAKRRRLDNGEQSGAPTLDELPTNVIECIKTIGELRELLQRETQLRLAYEKELTDLRTQMAAIHSPASSNTSSSSLSPTNSTSSYSPTGTLTAGNRNLLIELASRQQQQQHECHQIPPPPPHRPLHISPDVNILTSAIASLSKVSPQIGFSQTILAAAAAGATPAPTIGINTNNNNSNNHQNNNNNGPAVAAHHHFGMSTSTPVTAGGAGGGLLQPSNNNANAMPFFGGIEPTPKQPQKLVVELPQQVQQVQQQQLQSQPQTPTVQFKDVGMDSGSLNASISQRNLQALVLAIRHLEGASSGTAAANNLLVR